MAIERSPAFQFYPMDFLSDERQAAMTVEQAGVYVRLLCYCWREHTIPDDPKALALMVGGGLTPKRMAAIWPGIRACFQPDPEQPGRLRHGRLDRERDEQQAWRQKSATGGRTTQARRKGGSTVVDRVVEPPLQPNANTSVFSPLSSVQTPSVSVTRARGTETNQTPTIATGPHRQHAYCGAACVPAFLHQEFIRGLNRVDHDEADDELREGYRAHLDAWPVGQPTGDGVAFWRTWYRQKYTPRQAFGAGKTAGNAAALAAVLSTNRKAVAGGLD